MHDKNPMIRKVCDACLDVIAVSNAGMAVVFFLFQLINQRMFQMCDEDWAARIKVEKFRSHNQQWLEMVESIALDPSNHLMQDEDDSLPPFASGDLLKHTMLFPTSK